MPAFIDISGITVGRLKVVRRQGSIGGRPSYLCDCECGSSVIVRAGDLRSGKHRSCGCLQKDTVTKHGNTGAGGYKSPEYTSWISMNQRCNNPKTTHYHRYGGRGIKVCSRWADFVNFLSDMGKRPSIDFTLDRIDVSGDYEPNNCIWASRKTQSNNRENTHRLTHHGKTLTVSQWADMLNIPRDTIRGRLRINWSVSQTLTSPNLGRERGRDQFGRFIGHLPTPKN